MEELTGKPAAEVLGRRTVDLFPHLREQGVERLLERALSGETVTSPDVALHVPGTQKRGWVIGTYAPHRDAVGRINGVIGVVRDITERKRAEEELVAYQKRLRSLASELALVEQRERRRLATYLHDHIGQNLAMAKIKMDALWPSASKTDLAAAFDEIRGTMGSTIESTRSLTFDLSPPILYELGFEPAVEWLTEQFHERHGIVCRLKDDGQPKPLGDDLRAVLFEAVRELLYNVVKHAQARGATVSLRREGGEIRVMVEDDGVGFARDSAASRQARGGGFGLFNVRERLAHFGGRLQVESAPGRGTCVTLVAPLGGNDGKEQER
jgi:PAS domain S-box-containing protein